MSDENDKEKRPETQSPEIELIAEIEAEVPPPAKPLPLPDPEPPLKVEEENRKQETGNRKPETGNVETPKKVEAPPPKPAPDEDDDDGDDDEEPGWAALWSYETYEQVARKVLRAGTEVAKEGYQRHDAAVVVVALALIVVGGLVHRFMLQPPMETFDAHGLHFERTAHWLPPEDVPEAIARLVPDAPPPKRTGDDLPYHVMFTSDLDPDARLEVLVDHRPAWSNILTALELDRRNRYGELYVSDGGQTRSIAGHDWLRTSFRYAYAPSKGDAPRIGQAIEYATVDREQLYAVTFHGTPAELDYLEDHIAPTLRVASKTGMPLIPQNRITQFHAPDPVLAAMASTVMIVVADVVDGRLRPVGGGSGVVVSGDGSIVTNYHVLHDLKSTRLHDLFVIARQVGDSKSPQLVCAGAPSRSKFDAEHDLALLKCDRDLDGREWNPANGGWVPLGNTPRRDVGLGERLWVLGYPDVGGGGLTVSYGLVDGWTGEEESLAKDFIKTDASITHGNSGGPVVDDKGHVVGIATAFRVHVTATGETVETAKVGLVRPWSVLSQAIADARTGWIPREGESSMAIEPEAVDVAPEGVMISTHVVDAANGRPVPGAMLMVMQPGVRSSDVDVNRLDEQVVSWGRANADGEVHLRQPVPQPGSYTVVVVAPDYEPLAGDGALQLTEDSPPFYDPWGEVKIQASP